MNRNVSFKDVCLSWSKIVLLIYICLAMTEKPKVGLPGSFHASLLGPLSLELMFKVFF